MLKFCQGADRRMEGLTDRQSDRQMTDGQTSRRTNGQMDR